MKTACLFLVALVLLVRVAPGGDLAPGAIAVVAYNSDANDDDFAWLALHDIPANTTINFTDSSSSNGVLYWIEHLHAVQGGPLQWSHTAEVAAGTVVVFDDGATNWSVGTAANNAPRLNSARGDQLLAYTGTIEYDSSLPDNWEGNAAAAVMVWAVNFGNGGWTNVNLSAPTSSIPDGVSAAEYTAVHIDDKDNGYYNGPRTGTVSQLRSWIAAPSNWTTTDSAVVPATWPTAYQVLPDPPHFEFSRIDDRRWRGLVTSSRRLFEGAPENPDTRGGPLLRRCLWDQR